MLFPNFPNVPRGGTTEPPPPSTATAAEPLPLRRLLVLGLLAQPVFFGASTAFRGVGKPGSEQAARLAPSKVFDAGDAVTQPGLELEMLEILEGGGLYAANGKSIAQLVDELEEFQGSQLNAAGGSGKWVIPWVGGWERVYANSGDARYLGGPAQTELSLRGKAFKQLSQRHFVYGPGESGVTVEYLYGMPGASQSAPKLLLTRKATVTNQGDLEFTFGFDERIGEFEVGENVQSRSQERGIEFGEAIIGAPIEGGAEREPPMTARLKSTYLSERVWIVRDVANPEQVSVFARTETRSVADRRGLVADYQIKPPESEEVRYGGLLFADTLSEYANWDVKVKKEEAQKAKLLSR